MLIFGRLVPETPPTASCLSHLGCLAALGGGGQALLVTLVSQTLGPSGLGHTGARPRNPLSSPTLHPTGSCRENPGLPGLRLGLAACGCPLMTWDVGWFWAAQLQIHLFMDSAWGWCRAPGGRACWPVERHRRLICEQVPQTEFCLPQTHMLKPSPPAGLSLEVGC